MRGTRWQTGIWIALLVFAGFYVLAAVNDLIADARTGIPVDHYGTFEAVAGTGWHDVQQASPGVAAYVTLLERGYALHELVFGILFVVVVAIPLRRGQRWAWWACWVPTIANLGYALSFGAQDPAIRYRSLAVLVAMPVLLLASARAFLGRPATGR
jgi:hypothetical protein